MESAGPAANHWQGHKSLKESTTYLLEGDIATDVKFVVGMTDDRKQVFRAHKLILAARSSVFYSMFLEEDDQKDNGNIIVTDCDPRGFDVMLRFIYSDEANITESNVMFVLKTAEKYDIQTLEIKALEFTKTCLVPEKICGVLEQAVFFHREGLINLCLMHYAKNPNAALQSTSFSDMSHRSLMKILQVENVYLTENILFEACNKWAEKECERRQMDLEGQSKRKCLNDALHYIRFPLMDLSYFANNVSTKGILSETEEVAIFRYLTQQDKDSPIRELAFNHERRQNDTLQCNYEDTVSRFDIANGAQQCAYGTHTMTVEADRPIVVVGFRNKQFTNNVNEGTHIHCENRQIGSVNFSQLTQGIILNEPVILGSKTKKVFTFQMHAGYGTEGGTDGKQTMTGKDGTRFTFEEPNSAAFIDEILYFAC